MASMPSHDSSFKLICEVMNLLCAFTFLNSKVGRRIRKKIKKYYKCVTHSVLDHVEWYLDYWLHLIHRMARLTRCAKQLASLFYQIRETKNFNLEIKYLQVLDLNLPTNSSRRYRPKYNGTKKRVF